MKRTGEQGTSLIEVMIASALLCTLMAGLMAMAGLAISTTENQGHLAARATEYAQLPQSCAPPGGELNKEERTVGEHVALDELRERRTNHDDSRDNRQHDETKSGINEKTTRRIRLDDLSPWARLAYIPLRQVS